MRVIGFIFMFSTRLVYKYFPSLFKEADPILSFDHSIIFRKLISPACASLISCRLVHYLIKYKLLRTRQQQLVWLIRFWLRSLLYSLIDDSWLLRTLKTVRRIRIVKTGIIPSVHKLRALLRQISLKEDRAGALL